MISIKLQSNFWVAALVLVLGVSHCTSAKRSSTVMLLLLLFQKFIISYLHDRILTIAAQGKLTPVRVGTWVKVRVSFRVGGQPDNCPPRLGLVFGLGLVLGLGGNFPRGQLS